MEPHSPHSGHRPTHFGGRCPQASHSYAARVRGRAAGRAVALSLTRES